jgi:hypothetical protein
MQISQCFVSDPDPSGHRKLIAWLPPTGKVDPSFDLMQISQCFLFDPDQRGHRKLIAWLPPDVK